jgi:hypothetical protein
LESSTVHYESGPEEGLGALGVDKILLGVAKGVGRELPLGKAAVKFLDENAGLLIVYLLLGRDDIRYAVQEIPDG